MTENKELPEKSYSADWFMRGALARIGDTLDRLTGRKWIPSSSLSTSELIVRLKRLLDAEAREIDGKGVIVPHNIKLKMQWDKFSSDKDESLNRLQAELLAAAADHINDSLYYTAGPLNVEVKPDYFTEGVKLQVDFGSTSEEEEARELNVTMPGIALPASVLAPKNETATSSSAEMVAHFETKGVRRDKLLRISVGDRISVGRGSGNGLIIDDPSVSKIHASMVVGQDGALSIADTGSTNGTFVSGERISYGKAVRLSETDKVKFGDVNVAFEFLKPAVPEPAQLEEASAADDETIAIGDMEFRSRTPELVKAEAAPPEPVIQDTIEIMPKATSMPYDDVDDDPHGSKK